MKAKTKKKIIIGVLAVVIILLAVFIFMRLHSGGASAMAEVSASRQDIVTYYSFTGNIQSHDVQYVQAISNEPVKKFYVKEGQNVQEGDILYEVDSNTIQSTLTQASANLANANEEYDAAKLNSERMQSLYDEGGVSHQDLETANKSLLAAQNQVTQATANMQQAQNQYRDTLRYAEVSGEVSKIYVKENESLNMGTSIMDIVDYDNLEVEIKVDEYDLSAITVGKEADVQIAALGKRLKGTVSEIAREASVENGVSYFVATVVLPKDDDLRIGLTADIKIITQKAENVVAVPMAAVSYDISGAYVQDHGPDGKIERKDVTVGINDGRLIEIRDGVSEGDMVLISETAASSGTQQRQMMIMPGGGIRTTGGGGGGGERPNGGGSGSGNESTRGGE